MKSMLNFRMNVENKFAYFHKKTDQFQWFFLATFSDLEKKKKNSFEHLS